MLKVKAFTNDRGSIDTSINTFLEENNVVLSGMNVIEQSDNLIFAMIVYEDGEKHGEQY